VVGPDIVSRAHSTGFHPRQRRLGAHPVSTMVLMVDNQVSYVFLDKEPLRQTDIVIEHESRGAPVEVKTLHVPSHTINSFRSARPQAKTLRGGPLNTTIYLRWLCSPQNLQCKVLRRPIVIRVGFVGWDARRAHTPTGRQLTCIEMFL